METQTKIAHQQIVDYIHGKIDLESKKHLENIKEESSVYEMLFDLIDKLKQVAIINDKANINNDVLLPYSVIEEMLIRFLAGEIQKNDAQKFINGLLFSAIFYKRVINKIALAVKPPETEVISVQDNLIDGILENINIENVKRRQQIVMIILAYMWRYIRRYYIYVLPIVIISIISIWSLSKFGKKIDWNLYVEQFPYEESGLMGGMIDSESDSLFDFFKTKLDIGISYYTRPDYTKAIQIFKSIEPIALNLYEKSDNQSFVPWLRDLYFYWGLSSLHQAMKQGGRKSPESKFIKNSILYLSRADLIATLFNLDRRVAENYYLGIAYAMDEQKDLAIAQLRKIKKRSQYYDKSIELISKLNNNKN